MANTKQATKRAKQALKRRDRNFSRRSEVRTYVKKALKAIIAGDLKLAEQLFKGKVVPLCDRLARQGIIAKNNAARYKSRLSSKIKRLALSQ